MLGDKVWRSGKVKARWMCAPMYLFTRLQCCVSQSTQYWPPFFFLAKRMRNAIIFLKLAMRIITILKITYCFQARALSGQKCVWEELNPCWYNSLFDPHRYFHDIRVKSFQAWGTWLVFFCFVCSCFSLPDWHMKTLFSLRILAYENSATLGQRQMMFCVWPSVISEQWTSSSDGYGRWWLKINKRGVD